MSPAKRIKVSETPLAQRGKLLLCLIAVVLLGACTQMQLGKDPEFQILRRSASPLYQLQSFQLNPAGLPIAVATGDDDDLWVVAEFSDSLQHVGGGPDFTVEKMVIPLHAAQGQWPFVKARGLRTRTAQPQRIVKDNQGRLWFAQTGHWTNFAVPKGIPNYSRIVSYDPRNKEFCVYPVPDNNAAVMGVAWDQDRNRIWFSQSGNNTLVAFDPDELGDCATYNRYRWQFNDKGELANRLPIHYCRWPGESACLRKFPLPAKGPKLINQLVVREAGQTDPGTVWVTEFFSGHIGRLDPVTGHYQRFPLNKLQHIDPGRPATHFHRVHHILIHPLSGDMVFSANGSGEVFKFDVRQYLRDPAACETLDGSGRNPCMDAFQVPVFHQNAGNISTHSISFDNFGNLWISTWAARCPLDTAPPGIGFVDANWRRLIFLEDVQLLPRSRKTPLQHESVSLERVECDENGRPLWAFTGIAVDGSNNVWFTNYFQNAVNRMEFTAGADQNPYELLCDERCQQGH